MLIRATQPVTQHSPVLQQYDQLEHTAPAPESKHHVSVNQQIAG